MTPSERIDQLIAELADWRGKTFATVRKTILEADGEIVEEWKWMGSPVWSRDGIIAVANAHKGKVKLTFAHGAQAFRIPTSSSTRASKATCDGRSISSRATRSTSAPLKALVRAAIEYNQSKSKKMAPAGARAKAHKGRKT